jgi:hypothetical protein
MAGRCGGAVTRYARNTTVDRAGSVAELERLVDRYGATGFAYGRDGVAGWVMFRIGGRAVRLRVPMPDRDEERFTLTPTGRARAEAAAFAEWEQACRSRWRAVVLIVRAKLEAVESGISTVEREFLADLVLPDGRSVGDHVLPAVEESLLSGRVVRLLPEVTGG